MYYLGTSKLSIAILGNFLFMLSLLFYRLITMVSSLTYTCSTSLLSIELSENSMTPNLLNCKTQPVCVGIPGKVEGERGGEDH
jgi:hypothetical protein